MRMRSISTRVNKPEDGSPSMSALPPKADIGTQPRIFRFVPKADILHCGRDCYSITSSARDSSDCGTERPSAFAVFEVDDQFILRRRLYRKIGRLLTLEDAIDVLRRAPVGRNAIRAVGDEAAATREIR